MKGFRGVAGIIGSPTLYSFVQLDPLASIRPISTAGELHPGAGRFSGIRINMKNRAWFRIKRWEVTKLWVAGVELAQRASPRCMPRPGVSTSGSRPQLPGLPAFEPGQKSRLTRRLKAGLQ